MSWKEELMKILPDPPKCDRYIIGEHIVLHYYNKKESFNQWWSLAKNKDYSSRQELNETDPLVQKALREQKLKRILK